MRRRVGLTVVGVVIAALAAACAPAPSTLRIVNRTQVPVVVHFGDYYSLVVDACAERTVELSGGSWGAGNGTQAHEVAPAGAYVLSLPSGTEFPSGEGRVDVVLLLAQSFVGFRHLGSYDEAPKAGTGTFPPDPAAVECAGSPPPQPSLSAAPSSAAFSGRIAGPVVSQRGAGRLVSAQATEP
ncbi:MAG: hypothetical protein U0838_16580 [Chloroflexota bacterium]